MKDDLRDVLCVAFFAALLVYGAWRYAKTGYVLEPSYDSYHEMHRDWERTR
jgi:hypothetical protein